MHTFQTYPSDLFEVNPFVKIGKEWMLVTAGTPEKANALTASWGGLGVLWGKNVAFIFIRDSRYTKEFIDQNDTFSMNFFEEKYKNDLKYFGAVSGRQEDKFKTSGLTLNNHDGIPFVDEGSLILLCKKMAAVPITKETFSDISIDEKWYANADLNNYHTMYIGEVTEILAR
ncbi:MAG: flavin reductase family protein [Lachnospiraceae bacterium]|nr:flavin reductase family protein [Lachnospiraceae bacterium]